MAPEAAVLGGPHIRIASWTCPVAGSGADSISLTHWRTSKSVLLWLRYVALVAGAFGAPHIQTASWTCPVARSGAASPCTGCGAQPRRWTSRHGFPLNLTGECKVDVRHLYEMVRYLIGNLHSRYVVRANMEIAVPVTQRAEDAYVSARLKVLEGRSSIRVRVHLDRNAPSAISNFVFPVHLVFASSFYARHERAHGDLSAIHKQWRILSPTTAVVAGPGLVRIEKHSNGQWHE